VWQRRQKILPQQVTTELALIEGIERTNTVVVRGQEQGQGIEAPRRDPYAMEIDRERNYYTYGRFRHMAQHCGNREQRSRIAEGRRLEYGRRERNYKHLNNLKEVENLESLD